MFLKKVLHKREEKMQEKMKMTLQKVWYKYRVILKKVSFGIFRIILISKEGKKIYYGKQRQNAIFEQVSVIVDHCQNHQN